MRGVPGRGQGGRRAEGPAVFRQRRRPAMRPPLRRPSFFSLNLRAQRWRGGEIYSRVCVRAGQRRIGVSGAAAQERKSAAQASFSLEPRPSFFHPPGERAPARLRHAFSLLTHQTMSCAACGATAVATFCFTEGLALCGPCDDG